MRNDNIINVWFTTATASPFLSWVYYATSDDFGIGFNFLNLLFAILAIPFGFIAYSPVIIIYNYLNHFLLKKKLNSFMVKLITSSVIFLATVACVAIMKSVDVWDSFLFLFVILFSTNVFVFYALTAIVCTFAYCIHHKETIIPKT